MCSTWGRLQRELLAILLVEAGRVVSVDRIVDSLWGDAPPSAATKSTPSGGTLPGVSFADNGDGSATIAGTQHDPGDQYHAGNQHGGGRYSADAYQFAEDGSRPQELALCIG